MGYRLTYLILWEPLSIIYYYLLQILFCHTLHANELVVTHFGAGRVIVLLG